MSYQYDLYLAQHKETVKYGFEWIRDHLPRLAKSGWYDKQKDYMKL